jgi:hypothetical protein
VSEGPNAETTIKRLVRILDDQDLVWAVNKVYPKIESPDLIPSNEPEIQKALTGR